LRTTLFYIPAEVAGLPVFGFGLLLAAWLILCGLVGALFLRRPGGSRELASSLPVFAIVAGAIAFLLPRLIETDPTGLLLGVPVRGYGVMLMIATIASVALAVYRARQVGLDPEAIYSLAFVMFIAGIVGARAFYVIEYWQQEFSPGRTGSLTATFWAILNVPQGGLVVYGSVLFGLPAGLWYCRKRGLAPLAIGDLIAPSMLLGLALGRVGCFLNGCCYGGVCLGASYAVTFPAGSPPYAHHATEGWRSGIWLKEKGDQIVIAYLAPTIRGGETDLKPGDEIKSINGAAVASIADSRQKLATATSALEIETADGRVIRWQGMTPPLRSVPVHPAQLYATIDAALLALILWLYFPFRRREGEVFAIMLIVHPVSRFFLEMIRVDEPGQFGTALSISQWISIAIFIAGVVLLVFLESRPRKMPTPQPV
jgi:phosphatidylglycerol---prolipoprotein diacylglyceryl transferase